MAANHFNLVLARAKGKDYPTLVSLYQKSKPELDSSAIAQLTELGDRYYASILKMMKTIELFRDSSPKDRETLMEAYKLQVSQKRREYLESFEFYSRISAIIEGVNTPKFNITTIEVKNQKWCLPELVVIKPEYRDHFPYRSAGQTVSDPLWCVDWNCWGVAVIWSETCQLIPVEWLDASAACGCF